MWDLDLTTITDVDPIMQTIVDGEITRITDNVLGTEFGIQFRQTTQPGHDDAVNALAFAFDNIQGRPNNHE
jgi:hypothetical protein